MERALVRAGGFLLDISSSSAFRADESGSKVELPNDVLRGPRYVIDGAGRIRRLRPGERLIRR